MFPKAIIIVALLAMPAFAQSYGFDNQQQNYPADVARGVANGFRLFQYQQSRQVNRPTTAVFPRYQPVIQQPAPRFTPRVIPQQRVVPTPTYLPIPPQYFVPPQNQTFYPPPPPVFSTPANCGVS